MGWLHCLVDHGKQLGVQRVKVDLLTEPSGEGVDGPRRVIAPSVEVLIHDDLDVASGRLEQRSDSEGRSSDGKVGFGVAPL
jgi:hypothetical protein